MAGADLLDAPTGTAVAQRLEAGQGILGAKEGKGMWVWSAMVLAVLSSRMSAGGCSLAGRRDNVPCPLRPQSQEGQDLSAAAAAEQLIFKTSTEKQTVHLTNKDLTKDSERFSPWLHIAWRTTGPIR